MAVLWLSSTPLISGLAVRAAEGWAERGLATDASQADAIVVLSEGRVVAPGKAAVSEESLVVFKGAYRAVLINYPSQAQKEELVHSALLH